MLLRGVSHRWRGRSRRSARSRRPPSGSSTTSTSSRSSSARSATTCRRTTTASCRSWPTAPSTGYPRVLGLAWAYVAHTDSRFDPESLRRFVARLPAGAAADDRRAVGDRDQPADPARREPAPPGRADRAQPRRAPAAPTSSPTSLLGSAATARTPPRPPCAGCRERALPTAFAVQLVQRLRDQDPAVDAGAALARGAARRAGHDRRGDVRLEHQRQAAMNVTVRNVITSMRLISSFDWARVLRERQPRRRGAARARAAFARDGLRDPRPLPPRGRGAGARLGPDRARGRPAAAMAERPRARPDAADVRRDAASRDPGYYLIADGRAGARARARLPGAAVATGCGAPMSAPATPGYLGTLALVTALVLALPLVLLARVGRSGAGLLVVALLALGPGLRPGGRARQPGRHAAPRPAAAAAARAARRRAAELRTLVVVPTLLTERRRRRGAGRAPRGPLPRQPRRRPPLRPALRLARRADRACRGDDELLGGRASRRSTG